MIKHINESEFESYVINSSKPMVLVVYFASWCKSCQRYHDILDSVSRRFTTSIDILKIDIDNEQRLFNTLKESSGYRSIPVTVFVKSGQVVDHFSGVKSDVDISGMIMSHIKNIVM